MGAVIGTVEIAVDIVLPGSGIGACEGRVLGKAGVVDEDVDGTKRGGYVLEGFGHSGTIADIGNGMHHLGGAYLLRKGCDLRVHVEGGDCSPLRRKMPAQGLTDAAG